MGRHSTPATKRKDGRNGADQLRARGAAQRSASDGNSPPTPPRPGRRDKWLLAAAVTLELAWIVLLLVLAVQG